MQDQQQHCALLGLPITPSATIHDIVSRIGQRTQSVTVSFINPSVWAVQGEQPHYSQYLQRLSYVLADGIGVCLVYRWLTGAPCPRISFDMTSMAPLFFGRLQHIRGSLAVVGGAPDVAQQFAEKLQRSYPDIRLPVIEDGYGDHAPKIARILAAAPDAVIVGMGVPRQESFLVELATAGYKGCAVTCGGFLDQYIQAEHYYPVWINRYHLRFAYRFYKEPARLWRRYLIDYQLFIGLALRALLAKWFFRKSPDPAAPDSSDNGANRTNASRPL